jgi:hypothetical protein
MRFFSNDNRESNDEPSGVDVQSRAEQENPEQAHDEHPERVQSDPVTVPQQRSGSPWSDAPGAAGDTADAELADRERADGTAEPGYAGDHRTDADMAATGGGTEAVDLPLDDTATGTEATGETAGVGESGPVAAGSHVATAADTTTYGPDGTVDETSAADTDDGEPALRDQGGFDDPQAVDPATDQPLESRDEDTALKDEGGFDDPQAVDQPLESREEDAALRDEGGFDDPQAVDPATDQPLESRDEDAAPIAADGRGDGRTEGLGTNGATVEDTSAPVVPIPVPVGADGTARTAPAAADAGTTTTSAGGTAASGDKLPGSVAEPDLSSIFDKDAAGSFQERWRDVQLRFVDSPKDATTEAAGLLDEAVEKLAASLRGQKDKLHQVDSDDTEQLRVELRGYRDILNRIISL